MGETTKVFACGACLDKPASRSFPTLLCEDAQKVFRGSLPN